MTTSSHQAGSAQGLVLPKAFGIVDQINRHSIFSLNNQNKQIISTEINNK
jgi:hypothetical protein